jgi:hypothetical protein
VSQTAPEPLECEADPRIDLQEKHQAAQYKKDRYRISARAEKSKDRKLKPSGLFGDRKINVRAHDNECRDPANGI